MACGDEENVLLNKMKRTCFVSGIVAQPNKGKRNEAKIMEVQLNETLPALYPSLHSAESDQEVKRLARSIQI